MAIFFDDAEIEEESEDLKSLVSWGLPGYSRCMATTKGSMGKSGRGGTSKATKAKRKTSGARSTKNK